MKHGIPFDVAFSMDAELRQAMCMRFAMFDGNKFDWDNGCWEQRQGAG